MEPEWASFARMSGWLPPDEAAFRMWRARNLNGENCRWCGVSRIQKSLPHKPSCRFYSGPVKHGPVGVRPAIFGYFIDCACGTSYREHDTDGNRQDCPDREKTYRLPRSPDLLVTQADAGEADS